MQKLKRVLCLLLTCVLLAGILPLSVLAVEPHVSLSALTYKVNNGAVTITDCLDNAAGTLEIPPTIDGYPVTEIGASAFNCCDKITSVTLPDSVTVISDNAFRYCSSLASINIPAGVTSIGDGAFNSCSSLVSITIPSGVTEIGKSAFYGCSSLANISIPNGVTIINSNAFFKCTSLRQITLPAALTSIESYAFMGCTSLTSVVIPNNVKTIYAYAFADCTGLVSVRLGSSVETIKQNAFGACTSLLEIDIPNSVTSIGSSVFEGCTSLKKATVSGGLQKITTSGIFRKCTSLETVIINEGVESIDASTIFGGCTNLKTLFLPSSLYNIGSSVFGDNVYIMDIYYAGTAYGWGGVAIGTKAAEAFSTATMHYVPFKDTTASEYYYIPMTWAIDKGVTKGTSDTTFSPNDLCSQCQILTFLYRAAGSPAVSGGSAYTNSNITADQYYYKAMLWAYQQGVVLDKDLDPDAPCTRADVVTYLWRLAGKPAASGSTFTDVPSSASYAQAVAWAVNKGVTNGTSSTEFSPDKTCSRAQIVTFLWRAIR